MHDVNWWLMALSFLLGLLLTVVFCIRRVRREVPIYAALGRGPKADVKRPVVEKPKVEVPKPRVEVPKPKVEVPKPKVKAADATAAAVVGGVTAAKVVKDADSVRVTKSVEAPKSEYLVKGDEDTMRYFTVDSPDYEKVGAEVWFRDEASAERAGFLRWSAPGSFTVTDAVHGTVIRAGIADTTAKSAGVSGEPGPYGAGSAKAGPRGSGPAGWTIKGNEDSMLYHTKDSPSYEVTIAEVWFADEASAKRAGFARWDSRSHKK